MLLTENYFHTEKIFNIEIPFGLLFANNIIFPSRIENEMKGKAKKYAYFFLFEIIYRG